MESRYTNSEGDTVEWRFQEVETLDLLPDDLTDGREIYAEFAPIPPDVSATVKDVSDPESSRPSQTGV
jgi:hypothetical protein